MPSNHLVLCHPLLFLPSIFASIRVFSNKSALRIRWPKYWHFSISPSNEYSGLISFKIDCFSYISTICLAGDSTIGPWITGGLGHWLLAVENPDITFQLAFCIHCSASTDSINCRWNSIVIGKKSTDKWTYVFQTCVAQGLIVVYTLFRGFLGGSVVKNPPASAENAGDTGSVPGWGRSPGGRKWQPTPIFLPGKSHGWRRLVGSSPWGHKEMDTTEWACMLSF